MEVSTYKLEFEHRSFYKIYRQDRFERNKSSDNENITNFNDEVTQIKVLHKNAQV